jgi:class 3 adenylate cyclase
LNLAVESQLPAGTVTFLFTDIEGSTQLMRQLGEGYADVLADHRRLLRECLGSAGGREIDTQGDAFFFSFTRAREAVAGAVAAQRALAAHEWRDAANVRVRMGLHTGEPSVGAEGYHGLDVVRAARICSAGRGGQILMSETTRALIGNDLPEGAHVVDLGQQQLKDVQDERIFQLSLEREPDRSPELKPTREGGKSHADVLGDDFDQRIEAFVQRQMERGLARGLGRRAGSPPVATDDLAELVRPALSTAAVILAILVAGLIGLILVIKFAFF